MASPRPSWQLPGFYNQRDKSFLQVTSQLYCLMFLRIQSLETSLRGSVDGLKCPWSCCMCEQRSLIAGFFYHSVLQHAGSHLHTQPAAEYVRQKKTGGRLSTVSDLVSSWVKEVGRWREVHGQITRPSDKHFNRNEHITPRKGAFHSELEARKAFWQEEMESERAKVEGGAQGKKGISGRGRPLHKVTEDGRIEVCLLYTGTGTADRSPGVGD